MMRTFAALVSLVASCSLVGCSSSSSSVPESGGPATPGPASSGPGGSNPDSSGPDGGDAGFVSYDAGITACEAGTCFTCGDQTCSEGTFCQTLYPANEKTPQASCVALPSACASSPTCGCVRGNYTNYELGFCVEQPAICEDDGAGHVTLVCHFY